MKNEIYFNLCLTIHNHDVNRRTDVERLDDGLNIWFFDTTKDNDNPEHFAFFSNEEIEKIYKFFKNNG